MKYLSGFFQVSLHICKKITFSQATLKIKSYTKASKAVLQQIGGNASKDPRNVKKISLLTAQRRYLILELPLSSV